MVHSAAHQDLSPIVRYFWGIRFPLFGLSLRISIQGEVEIFSEGLPAPLICQSDLFVSII